MKSPKAIYLMACSLEVGIFTIMVFEKSVPGITLCAGYLWFSATWGLVQGWWKP